MARIAPLVVFALVFAYMFSSAGHFLSLSNNDEGIYLDAGRRVAEGQTPYRDFFYLSGPATPWTMGLSMKLFGTNLPAARLPLIFDVSLITALIFWMSRRLSGHTKAASISAFLFLSFTAAQPAVLLPNHRWDSSAMALAAIALVWLCREQPRWQFAALAGLAVAAATWATPSLGLLAITLSVWHLSDRGLRASAGAFLAGGFGGLAAGIVLLWSQGALGPMVDQLFWVARHYSGANRMFYGSVIGGYGALFEGTAGAEKAIAVIIVCLLAVPAWLPIAATAGWLVFIRFNRGGDQPARFPIVFLLVCGAVLIAAQAPRLDVPHLLFASPVYYALGAALFVRMLSGMAMSAFAILCLLVGCVFAFYASLSHAEARFVQTPVGRAKMHYDEGRHIGKFASHIHPGDSLFVFPYRPVLYFALAGRNPTRYSFLQPGMSSIQDESNVLADLRRNPPQWVIHLDIKPEEYLRVWPSSDPSRLRMESIERFIADGYAPVTQVGPYSLLRRR